MKRFRSGWLVPSPLRATRDPSCYPHAAQTLKWTHKVKKHDVLYGNVTFIASPWLLAPYRMQTYKHINPPLYFRHILDFDAQSWKHYTFDNVLFHLPLPQDWPKENMYWNWLLSHGSLPPSRPPWKEASTWDLFIRPCTKALLITTVSKWPPKSYQNGLQNHIEIATGWKVKTTLSSRREAHSHSAKPLRILSKPTSLSIPYQTLEI